MKQLIDIINEEKKKYIAPKATLIEIPANLNLSDIDLETIVNQFKENENDINIIEPK